MDGAKEGEEVEVLEGEQIYLLMKKEYSTISHKGLEFKYFFTPKS